MNNKKLSILLLNSSRYDPAYPARTEIIEIYGNKFPQYGHNITWVNPGNTNEILKRKFKDVTIYVVPSVPYTVSKSLLKKGFNIITHSLIKIKLVKELIKISNIDIIQTRDNIFDGLIALKIRKKYNIPFAYQLNFIQLETNLDYNNKSVLLILYKKFARLILNYILKKADVILPISTYMQNYLKKKKFEEQKIFTLPMGVNSKSFSPNQKTEKLRSKYELQDKITFIYIGSMAKKRRLDIILKAFSLVTKEVINAKLLIVGDGDGKEELEKLCKNLNLERYIIFAGKIPYKNVPKYICLADIGLSPIPPINNYKLSSPTKLLEYMACEIPVIGNREIFDMKYVISKSNGGILVDFNAKSFSSAMIRLAKNEELAKIKGENGRQWINKNRSYKQIAMKLEKFYLKIIKS
ncbi:MAG: glycosyltransferase family 4 protein [Patescibacteria group bacterium]|nr:glycosyltransferase family 4 protein [Patescibacteria group bacterium]